MQECQLHILKCWPARSQWKCWDTFILDGNRKMRPQRHTPSLNAHFSVSFWLAWLSATPLLLPSNSQRLHPAILESVPMSQDLFIISHQLTHADFCPKSRASTAFSWSGLNSGLHCSATPQWFAAVPHFFGPYPWASEERNESRVQTEGAVCMHMPLWRRA